MKQLYTICYTSRAASAMDEEQLGKLFSKVASTNTAHGITGILIYSFESFFQVMEGEEEVLLELYEKIRKDSRHKDVFEVFNKTALTSVFTDYNSSFNIITAKPELERVKEYLDSNRRSTTFEKLSRLLTPFVLFD